MSDEELRRLFAEMRQQNAADFAEMRQQTAAEFAEMRQEFAEMRQQNAADFADIRQKNAADFADMRQKNAADFADMRQESAADFANIRQENAAEHAETRRHFDVTTEKLEHKIELVAEAVVQLDAKVDREIGTLRGEMRQGFLDTHALLKFSYGDLDQRLKALE